MTDRSGASGVMVRERTWAAAAAALVVCAVLIPVRAARGQDPAGAAAGPPRVVIDGVQVRGAIRLDPSVIAAESGLRAGDTITYRDVNRAIRRLWATGRYEDVQASVAASGEAGERATIILDVVERPYVARIDFEGLEQISAGTIRDTVGLRPGAPLEPAKVAEAKAMVRDLLASKGFQLRSIDHRLEELDSRPGEYRLVFDVVEGQRVAIAEIAFEGNEAFSDDRLRSVMESRKEGFFWFRKGTYDEEKLRRDIRENLPEFYGQHGYIDFTVTGDTLIVDPETGKARLVISVDEGPQYRLAEFDIRGNRRFATEDLARYFKRQTGGLLNRIGLGRTEERTRGEVFDRAAFQAAVDEVRRLYNNHGYLYAQILPEVERIRTEDGEPAVRLAWTIHEGEPAYINKVEIKGNTFTHEEVIRERIFLFPGDVYSEEALIQSYQSIMGLGFFETPLPMPQIEPTETGDVNVTFEVKEKQTGSINFGTSVGGWGGVAGFLGYDQPNLFGQAKSGHLRWEYGRYSNNFEMSYADPAIRGSRLSGSLALFNARDRFIYFDEGERRRIGTSLRFGVPFPLDRRWTRVFLGYSLSKTKYRQFEGVEGSLFELEPGLQSAISLGLVRGRLDNPLFPTQGSRQEIEAALSGGFLGGDADFQKYTTSGSWWVPVGQLGGKAPGSRPIRMALGLSADMGIIVGSKESLARFPFERFWLGGVQFGRPLRGYDETTITPGGYSPRSGPGAVPLQDRLGDAYLRLSAEYAIRLNDNISVSAFYDAGNIWRSPGEINPTRLFRGAGLGLTLVTPFGPLGLDYAYGFDKDRPGWQFHFKFGQGF